MDNEIARKQADVVGRVADLSGRLPDHFAVSAVWFDERGYEAGVTAGSEGVQVHYGSGFLYVGGVEEAADLPRRIFADEIVWVTALVDETPAHHALARHDDPGAGFADLQRPMFDQVMVRSWSGKRDRD